ncbi:hypothetical protein [Salinimicrobium terrae]|uniref:hypothetical protein n=1 Tax=Salinimicrobium terrae TaxID=470866 RepID=UPI000418F2A4|nr:hypothetical protein [Salinimicrobium terrae]
MQQLKIFISQLVLALIFFSIGGGLAHASGLPEVRKEQPFSSEKIVPAHPLSVTYHENQFQEIPELLKRLLYGSTSVIPHSFDAILFVYSEGSYLDFRRDLRKYLQIQLFPKHFFL